MPIPRMRTAAGAMAEIKAMDPNTEITVYLIRQIIKQRKISVSKFGQKFLINLDDLLEFLVHGEPFKRIPEEAASTGGIRRVAE